MQSITKKSEIRQYVDYCVDVYHTSGVQPCVQTLEKEILSKKVKFPLLEYCGHVLYEHIDLNEQILFCDRIAALQTVGGNVLLGIMLQHRLFDDFESSIDQAAEYVSKADAWYVCDIIGERVFGYALLYETVRAIPEVKKLMTHDKNWVIRSLGAGAHYAIKKGLEKSQVQTIFKLLLNMSHSRDKEIRQGIGWAAKTTAKFHPDIINQHREDIYKEETSPWFKKKVEIGLGRNSYDTVH